jgi:hypothetical protein
MSYCNEAALSLRSPVAAIFYQHSNADCVFKLCEHKEVSWDSRMDGSRPKLTSERNKATSEEQYSSCTLQKDRFPLFWATIDFIGNC